MSPKTQTTKHPATIMKPTKEMDKMVKVAMKGRKGMNGKKY